MGSFVFNLPTAGAANLGANIDTNLYSKTKDADLTYGGDDTIVWDRIDAERLRRGLPGLAEIGSPRPPEEETPTASESGGGGTFEVKGPPGMTFEQAKAIFDQQVAAGSFVGFKPGDVLNSAKQAAAGLPGAASQLTQSLTGTTSIINGSVINNAVGQISGQVSQAVNQAVSVAKQSVSTLTGVLSKVPVTNGINTADFAKQVPALTSMGSLTSVDVRAGLAQASKLVGQASDKITDAVGVGKFGLDASQLEAAGVLKPGVASQYLQSGANSLTSVLKSPTVFTGKDGIKSLTDLLNSDSKQNAIQQNLMAQGLSGLKQVGIPTDSLNPSALTGTVLNAAKSLPNTVDWAKGLPLPPGVKTSFDTVARDSAFAVDFAKQKVDNSLKQEIVPTPASDTVNRETLNAAATRVVGNPKVPPVSYSSKTTQRTPRELDAAISVILNNINILIDASIVVMSKSDRTRAETNSYNADIRNLELLIADLQAADGQLLEIVRESNALEPPFPAITARAETIIEKAKKAIAVIQSAIDSLRKTLANLSA